MGKVKLPDFKLIGLKLDKKTINTDGQSSMDCGNLWQKFEKGNLAKQIPDKLGNEVYAVYFDYEGDHTKAFSYFIGCKVKPSVKTPPEMDTLLVPEQAYKKVLATGKMPDCISKSWEDIWSSELERDYGYDFEVYDRRSQDWSNAEVDIYVSSK